ncbi:MAG: carboxypeptidase regulatory-like domain-containing protein [Bacilli bacterium]|nr:carboxypeptidase regulatory-like domain-containing protein [Bacilli bacterium]
MNKKLIYMTMIYVMLFIATISFAYAFFSISLNGDGKENVVTAGTLRLEYLDGPGVSLPRAYPGESATKVISVKNTGTLETSYDLIYKDLINEIEKDELVISYTCTSYTGYVNVNNKGTVSGTCEGLSEDVVPYSETTTDALLSEDIEIASGITHEYNITIMFIELESNQNYNQGKTFNTKITLTQPDVINIATYKLSGTLLDDNNNPITNATVEIHSKVKTGVTDSKGYFEIEGVEAGNHEFKVKNSSGTYIIEDTIKVIEANESNVSGKEISVKEGEEGISLNIKTNNGKLSNIEAYKENTLYEKILADNQGGQSDENIDFSQVSSDTNGKGLYYTSKTNVTEDLNGDGIGERVYYYRGDVTNNNVRFGGYCWRIVRTNEDGSVRMRYNGTYSNGTCPVTGTDVKINNQYYYFNAIEGEEKYNEYIWEDATGESNAKTVIDAWYTSSGLESYANQIANVPYCADKSNPISVEDEEGGSPEEDIIPLNVLSFFENYYTFYGAANRLYDFENFTNKNDVQPTYKCERTIDKHTVNGDNWGGNGKLQKPIGLLTADEVAFAGGVYNSNNSNNSSYYLYISNYYCTMSPAHWRNSRNDVNIFTIDYNGSIFDYGVNNYYGLLPVISLKPEVTVVSSGTGSYTNPYVIVTE